MPGHFVLCPSTSNAVTGHALGAADAALPDLYTLEASVKRTENPFIS